jgi:hypothetical protein
VRFFVVEVVNRDIGGCTGEDWMKRFLRLMGTAALVGAVVAVPAASGSSVSPASLLGAKADSPQYTLTVNEIGTGSGTVTTSPAGIDCPSTCSAAFPAGTRITLYATPAADSKWGGFGAPCRNFYGRCVITLGGDMTVRAVFWSSGTILGSLFVQLAGSGSGTVTSSPAAIDCPAACGIVDDVTTQDYQYTLTATADPGSTFSYWSGGAYSDGICSATGPCVVTVSRTRPGVVIFATFTSDSPPPPPPPCVVPHVKGTGLAIAKQRITNSRCSVGKVTRVQSSPKNKGRVISQYPRAETQLQNGGRVSLKIGRHRSAPTRR